MCQAISALLAQPHLTNPNTDAEPDTIVPPEACRASKTYVAEGITAKRVHLSQYRARQEGLC